MEKKQLQTDEILHFLQWMTPNLMSGCHMLSLHVFTKVRTLPVTTGWWL